jgi:hypothetical protein
LFARKWKKKKRNTLGIGICLIKIEKYIAVKNDESSHKSLSNIVASHSVYLQTNGHLRYVQTSTSSIANLQVEVSDTTMFPKD